MRQWWAAVCSGTSPSQDATLGYIIASHNVHRECPQNPQVEPEPELTACIRSRQYRATAEAEGEDGLHTSSPGKPSSHLQITPHKAEPENMCSCMFASILQESSLFIYLILSASLPPTLSRSSSAPWSPALPLLILLTTLRFSLLWGLPWVSKAPTFILGNWDALNKWLLLRLWKP